jgi:DNA recombination protein Rad52
VDRMLATKPLQSDLHTRKGPGGRQLVYYNGETVSRLLNEVFGYDGWNMAVLQTEKICCTESDGKFSVGFMARVRITHRNSGTYKEDMGSGDSVDRSLPTAVQNAIKGAITDAMKRAARHFGEKLGNSLYSDGFSLNTCPKTVGEALEQYDRSVANKWGVSPAGGHSNNANKGPPPSGKAPVASYIPPQESSPPNQVHRPPLQQASTYRPNMAVQQPNAVSIVSKSLPPPQTPQSNTTTLHRGGPSSSNNGTLGASILDAANNNAYKVPTGPVVTQQQPPPPPPPLQASSYRQGTPSSTVTVQQMPSSVTPQQSEIPKRPESSYGRRSEGSAHHMHHNVIQQPQLKKPKLNPYSS